MSIYSWRLLYISRTGICLIINSIFNSINSTFNSRTVFGQVSIFCFDTVKGDIEYYLIDFRLVIEAFLTLTRQMNDQESFCNTTNQGPSNQGLPPVPQVVESRSPETPKKDQTKQRKSKLPNLDGSDYTSPGKGGLFERYHHYHSMNN